MAQRKPYHINRRRRRARFSRNKSGSTAVEFAIVAPVFLAFMFSIFEIGWFFFVNSAVDAAVGDAARLVKTGQVQRWAGDDDDKFDNLYDNICNIVKVFGSCSNRLTMEVETYESFSDLTAVSAIPATCANALPEDVAAIPFNTGGELEIVRVRICYLYTTLNPLLKFAHASSLDLAESGTNQRRIVSTIIFRNEPYELNNR